jgi:hypothetical protein
MRGAVKEQAETPWRSIRKAERSVVKALDEGFLGLPIEGSHVVNDQFGLVPRMDADVMAAVAQLEGAAQATMAPH